MRSESTPHCVAGRCVACVVPRGLPQEAPECAGATTGSTAPICDRNACRPCLRHSECLSGVCAKDATTDPSAPTQGSCVPAEQVLVVDQDLCSATGPVYCTPQQAFARLDFKRRYVLLRKSAMQSDFSGLTLGGQPSQTGQKIYLIGPLADHPPHLSPSWPAAMLGGIADAEALNITQGDVVLEGLFVNASKVGVRCTGSDTSVQIVRSLFSDNVTAISARAGCLLSISETWIGSGPQNSGFRGLPGNDCGIEINAAEFHIVNSVFADNGKYATNSIGGLRLQTLNARGPRSTIINSTFYQQEGVLKGDKYITTIICDNPLPDRVVLLNSLFLTERALLQSPEEHYFDPACGLNLFHLGSNDSMLSANQGVILPERDGLFINAPGRDLRLVSGNEADRMALATGGVLSVSIDDAMILAPTTDMLSQPRGRASGQSAEQLAIGAFEPVRSPVP